MKILTGTTLFLLCIVLYSCSCDNKAANESGKCESKEKIVDIENSQEKRIIDPNTNSKKSTNLWIDLNTYAQYYIEKDIRGFVDMTIPRVIQYVGDSTMINALDKYFDSRDDFDYLSIKSEEDVFHITENSIIAFVTQTTVYTKDANGTNSSSFVSIDKEIIAESIDNGVNWKFADIGHLKFEGIENFYSKEDCELIQNQLSDDQINKVLKMNKIIYRKNPLKP